MRKKKTYRCEALSVGGFVQQLAHGYVKNGSQFYVTGQLPDRVDPRTVDEKLIEKYGILPSGDGRRTRRKQAGFANLHYLRHGQFFVLLATKGKHEHFWKAFPEGESGRDEWGSETRIKNLRKGGPPGEGAKRGVRTSYTPIQYEGYSIAHIDGHVSVRLALPTYQNLKAHFLELSAHRNAETLAGEFYRLPYEMWAPVVGQVFAIVKAMNERRKASRYEPVVLDRRRLVRRIYRPFDSEEPVAVFHYRKRLPVNVQGCEGRAA